MSNKSHLKFLNEQQKPEIKEFNYNYGFDPKKEEKKDITPKNYFRLAMSFRADLKRYQEDINTKYSNRDYKLEVPHDIDYIVFTFQDQFIIDKYFDDYYNNFGLEATAFYDFAKKVYLQLLIEINSKNLLNRLRYLLKRN
ncbi:hypothetical protein H3Z85_13990 [Chryseobacterium indologenes]|nr:hypothetical protein H3Z85_13990 [Chryseobacterium indologenes]